MFEQIFANTLHCQLDFKNVAKTNDHIIVFKLIFQKCSKKLGTKPYGRIQRSGATVYNTHDLILILIFHRKSQSSQILSQIRNINEDQIKILFFI